MSPDDSIAPQLELSVESAPDGSVLGQYRFTNTSGRPLLVLDLLYRADRTGDLTLDPELAYVFFDNGRLIAARQMVRVPDGLTVYAPEIPCVRRAAPGQSLEGSFALRPPFRCYDPYTRPLPALPEGRIEEILLSIGFFAESPDVHLYGAKMTSGEILQFPAYSHIVQRQELIRSEPLPWPKP
jgi:hypothetical protein